MRAGNDGALSRPPVIVRCLGLQDYRPLWGEMQAYTEQRGPDSPDQIWFLQHRPVFTLGLNGRMEHVLAPGQVPVIAVDRGGQVTYHGPGQLIAYTLIDLRRLGLGVRSLVRALEQAVIAVLAQYGIAASTRTGAPGVYVDGRKIASLGLRVRKGCSFHGLALNVDMDLAPFSRIDPCGYPGLEVTQLADCGGPRDPGRVARDLRRHLLPAIGYESNA